MIYERQIVGVIEFASRVAVVNRSGSTKTVEAKFSASDRANRCQIGLIIWVGEYFDDFIRHDINESKNASLYYIASSLFGIESLERRRRKINFLYLKTNKKSEFQRS